MTLATTVALAVVRGPVALAKALAAIDVLSGGRLVAAVGPGSSQRDYDAVGIAFEERWRRFDESIAALRALLRGEAAPVELAPGPFRPDGVPLWIGSWGSKAGLARVARAGDGWLASAYNTTPEGFAVARGDLARALGARGREPQGFPNALATMWTWVCDDRAEADRVLGRRPRTAAAARSRRAARTGVRRSARALRRGPLPLRAGGLRARLPVAAGRRAAPARAGCGRGRAPDRIGASPMSGDAGSPAGARASRP